MLFVLFVSNSLGSDEGNAKIIGHEEHKEHEGSVSMHEPISQELEAIATAVVDAAFIVHRELGPGLLESVYEVCLQDVLSERGSPANGRSHFPSVS